MTLKSCTVLYLFFALAFVITVHAVEDLRSGVIAEKVAGNSEAESAGIREGDLLLRWTREDAGGTIGSPFDLFEVEVEQAPRGTVLLEGRRGAESRTWRLNSIRWGISSRPVLQAALESVYQRGKELEQAGKVAQAAEEWKAEASHLGKTFSPWLAAWLLLRAADALAGGRHWDEADVAFQESLRDAEGAGPAVVGQLLRQWAMMQQKRNDWEGARRHHLEALLAYQRLGVGTLAEARSLNDLGVVTWQSGDLTKSEEYFQKALAVKEKVNPGTADTAGTLTNLGAVAWRHGDLERAQSYYQQSLEIQKKLAPESASLALSLSNLGVLYRDSGDLAKAEEFGTRALAIREKLLPGSEEVAASYLNLGSIELSRGKLDKGEEYYVRALEIWRALAPESLSIANCLNGLGLIASYRGDLAKAEELSQQALLIQQKLAPSSPSVTTTLDNLGVAFASRGDLDKAEKYFTEALAVEEKIAPGSLDCATIHMNLGDIALERHSLVKAEQYYLLALTIREKQAPESLYVAASLYGLGAVSYIRDDLSGAEAYYRQALAIQERLAPQSLELATTWNDLGNIARDRNDLIQAGEYYRHGLAIREKFAPGSASHAESLANFGSILQRTGQLEAAAKFFEQSLDALEKQAGRLGGGEETRSNFRAKYSGFYFAYIDFLMARRQPAAAFAVVERARARSLLELLAEAHIDIRKGVDATLLKQEEDVRHELNANLNRRSEILREKHNRDQQLAEVNQEIEALLARYQEIEGRIRVSSPYYAALTQPKALAVSEVQEQLLDDETVLLEYSLGEKHSYVFAVTASSLHAYELPQRAEIEASARRVYDLLTARNRRIKDETEQHRRARWAKAETEYPQAVAGLSKMVLAPVAAQLGAKRLLIVSDGALHYIPFTILLNPASDSRLAGGKPLVLEHDITILPSATTLAVLRKQFAGRKPAPRDVMVLADPVFDARDDRMQSGAKGVSAGSAPGDRHLATAGVGEVAGASKSSREVGISDDGVFPRLPFTRREAEAIYAIAGPERVTKILDFDANKTMATSWQLKDYRIIHLATHGMLNNDHPDLTGLVFSLVNSEGKMQDGFVRLLDIYNLDLNADLVVLSACQTALGKRVEQEGFVGLTRGFMYAGAARVMATLWSVDDEATAELMKKFYENAIGKNQTPAQALRMAQTWMYSQKAWRSPYYWAGFALQGEWK